MIDKYITYVKPLIFLFLIAPTVYLLYCYLNNALGINPLSTLIAYTGQMAFICLLLTLLLSSLRRWFCLLFRFLETPFGRRLADWNWLIKCRRMIGLFCFYYASVHLGIYFSLDLALDWLELLVDAGERPFIVIGLVSWLLLLSLSMTSPKVCMRKMGHYWRKLHRSIYLIALLASWHFFWLAKLGNNEPFIYAFLVFILLLDRLLFATVLKPILKDDGMESKRTSMDNKKLGSE